MKDWTGNEDSIFKAISATNHSESEREHNDYYATAPLAIDKLLAVESPHKHIWECACGEGHLSRRLIENGYIVWNTDIIERRWKRLSAIQDFLKATESPFYNDYDIITNPPYKYAKEFVLKALDLLPSGCKCYMFLKLTFLEGKARYRELFNKYPPIKIYVFTERVKCAKNGDFKSLEQSGGSAVAYAWFVWLKGYTGKTQIEWI